LLAEQRVWPMRSSERDIAFLEDQQPTLHLRLYADVFLRWNERKPANAKHLLPVLRRLECHPALHYVEHAFNMGRRRTGRRPRLHKSKILRESCSHLRRDQDNDLRFLPARQWRQNEAVWSD